MRRVWLVCFLLGCHGSPPEQPKRTDKIIFSHDFHQKLDFDCDTCHTDVKTSTSLDTASLLPKEAKCLECHEEHKKDGDCAFCHADPKRPATYFTAARTVNMPHAQHVGTVACARCHTALPESDQPPPARATMETCTSCHQHEQDYAQARCEPCHKDLSRFGVKPVASFSHQGRFLAEHGAAARTGAETCARCHDQTFCADCHAKTVATRVEVRFPEDAARAFVHRGDYLSRHSIDAAGDPASCARCHGTSFCQSCHTLQNLTTEVASPRNPHPPEWSFPGNGRFHGDAARQNIEACASCHDQGAASVCVGCHKVGGIGGNPHPPGWTDRHGRNELGTNSMCAACHG